MKKILTIALILTNIILVPLALAGATEDTEDTEDTIEPTQCASVPSTYATPDGFFDSELSEPLTGNTEVIGLEDGTPGVANAYRNTYSCTADEADSTVTAIQSTACTGKAGCTSSMPIQILRANSGSGLLVQYVNMIFKWGASLAGMVAVVIIIWSGIQISTSQGKDVEGAKNRIIQSLSGLALLFLSGLLLYTINPTFFVK